MLILHDLYLLYLRALLHLVVASCTLRSYSRLRVLVHHASPGLPEVALEHAVLEESLAWRDAVRQMQEAVVETEGQDEQESQDLGRPDVDQLDVVGGCQRMLPHGGVVHV